ncbi:DNA methyltransferase [Desulfosarcina ovata subsp. sediminis]|uniref:DNA (cytosine-5-)-methyltransferase n=1 Tax=Desulfosarcina ovata subsp. sediminis TaxID=885957 RepID=A0A5K7ZR20_9BACT|nr:DNA cytosine methyltransferase [Desulfosarcina ovata]BBO80423.1 DNA methyltransferase [Desulfosarcina ovata subsp. sediminis]
MLKFIDLFCGGGFGARGAVWGGGTPLLAIDSWKLATETYKANFPDTTVIQGKIEDIDPLQYKRKFKPKILLTSPECTAHSIARGAKPGSERSRETALGMFPWIETFKPRWVIVENVNRMKKWDRHEEIIVGLEKSGYSVSQLLLNASEFGTPQSRKRLFLLCDRNGSLVTKEDLLKSHKKGPKTARQILDPPDTYNSSPLYKDDRAIATIDRAERAIKAIGKRSFLIVYYGSDKAGGWQSLDDPLRTVTTLDRFGLVTWKKGEPMLRMLQPRELLRAMGAGTGHKLPVGNRRDRIRLCGNGVCSPVMEVIFRKIKKIMWSEN